MSKNFSKCPNVFWGVLSEKNFLPSVPWRVESSKIFKKIKKFWKFQKSPNISQKCANVFCTSFGAIFSNKLLPSVPWRVESSKNFKNPKSPKIIRKSVQTCFEHALGRFIRIFFAQYSMQGFSDFLHLKFWVQFSGLKSRNLVCRT